MMIKYNYRLLISVLLILCTSSNMLAQEINAKVRINSSKVESSRQAMQTLENELHTFVNNRNWTDVGFNSNERIDCNITLIISEASSATSFKGELYIQSQRPVFNSTYSSPMINYRDTRLSFDYFEHQPLDFDLNRFDNNLMSTLAYYIYLILGVDFDSMSPLGGTPYYQNMMTIATNAQSVNSAEWGSFTDSRSRSSLAAAFGNSSLENFRHMWYQYHRKGLDEMASNLEEGRKNIVTSLAELTAIKSRQPNSILISIFGDSKLDEVVDIANKSDRDERREVVDILYNLYPARGNQIDRLQK